MRNDASSGYQQTLCVNFSEAKESQAGWRTEDTLGRDRNNHR